MELMRRGFASAVLLIVALGIGVIALGIGQRAGLFKLGPLSTTTSGSGLSFGDLLKSQKVSPLVSPAPTIISRSPVVSNQVSTTKPSTSNTSSGAGPDASTANPIPSPSPTGQSSGTSTNQPSSYTPTNSSPQSANTTATCNPNSSRKVKPYLVYPADKSEYGSYQSAVSSYMVELQKWYCDKVGATFNLDSLSVIHSGLTYGVMRCGAGKSDAEIQSCLADNSGFTGSENDQTRSWDSAVIGAVSPDGNSIPAVFAVGGGGRAFGIGSSIAVVGDWVLEPLAGTQNSWGIPCSFDTVGYCSGGYPKGTMAHELGHAFGLGHTNCNGCSVMINHGGYPNLGFTQDEANSLKGSPYFSSSTLGVKNTIKKRPVWGIFDFILQAIRSRLPVDRL